MASGNQGGTGGGSRTRATDQLPRGDEDIPPMNASTPGETRPLSDRQSAANPGDDAAAGSVDHPVAPGEAQAGDLSELGANLGGPVDVFPLRDRQRKERPAG